MSPEVIDQHWLPVVFMVLMGLALLLYVCLDGFDLGIGMLMLNVQDDERDKMLATIAPFWDANETWLVLGIGLLLVAFPLAHGVILGALYLPVALMLLGLILRGVAFDFRVKAHSRYKLLWDRLFFAGSALTALSQGYMLGAYIMGFELSISAMVFSVITAICLCAAYCFIGACWLIVKSSGSVFDHAIHWAKICMRLTAVGIVVVSAATPWVSERIFERWFSLPEVFLLIPIPLLTGATFIALELFLAKIRLFPERWHWLPFVACLIIFVMSFHGLAYSFFPYIVPEKLTLWEASSSIESLRIIFYGTVVVLPSILLYTIYSHRVFKGKIDTISYDGGNLVDSSSEGQKPMP